MNAEKLTQKSIETINRAQQIACEKRHSMVTQLHLAYALLDEANDLNRQLFTAMGVDAAAMLKDIDSGLIDCVIVKDLSRFGRERIETGMYILKEFESKGVRFIAINDNEATGPLSM